MLKVHELIEFFTHLGDDVSKDWKEFLQFDYETIGADKIVVNFVEIDEDGNFHDNKYLIEAKFLTKEDEHFDKVETWADWGE